VIQADSPECRIEAATVIRSGGIVAFRTDTFYGLGVDPLNPVAVETIKGLKGREETKPILLLISDLAEIDRFIVHRSEIFDRVTNCFWPGPITLIGRARPDLPQGLTAGTGSIGVRLPDDESVRGLVRICGGAITATSANTSGNLPARTAKEVANYFPRGLDLIIDGGEVSVTEPSTVLDLSATPRLIREGVIKQEAIEEMLSRIGSRLD